MLLLDRLVLHDKPIDRLVFLGKARRLSLIAPHLPQRILIDLADDLVLRELLDVRQAFKHVRRRLQARLRASVNAGNLHVQRPEPRGDLVPLVVAQSSEADEDDPDKRAVDGERVRPHIEAEVLPPSALGPADPLEQALHKLGAVLPVMKFECANAGAIVLSQHHVLQGVDGDDLAVLAVSRADHQTALEILVGQLRRACQDRQVARIQRRQDLRGGERRDLTLNVLRNLRARRTLEVLQNLRAKRTLRNLRAKRTLRNLRAKRTLQNLRAKRTLKVLQNLRAKRTLKVLRNLRAKRSKERTGFSILLLLRARHPLRAVHQTMISVRHFI